MTAFAYFSPAARKVDLGISSFGISVTTMEEVFIKVGHGTDETLESRWAGTSNRAKEREANYWNLLFNCKEKFWLTNEAEDFLYI